MNKSVLEKNYKWIILVHHLPPRPTSCRVKVWRRLKGMGAVAIKNSVYVLPFTGKTYEGSQWLRQEIVTHKGEATIFKVDSIEGMSNKDIVNQFRKARDKEYAQTASGALKLKTGLEANVKKNIVSIARTEKYKAELNKLIVRFNEIAAIDYFHAQNRRSAEKEIADCAQALESLKLSPQEIQPAEKAYPIKIYNKNEFQNKLWVTRKGIHIDRIASGWLIKKFIDPQARFSFIPEDDVVKNGIGFDMYNTELSHRGDDCTFEILLKSFALKDAALEEIARIVHDIDLKDGKFDRKEAEGINLVITGFSKIIKNDEKLLNKGLEIFDALYQQYSLKTQGGN